MFNPDSKIKRYVHPIRSVSVGDRAEKSEQDERLQIEICACDLLPLLSKRELTACQLKCLNKKTKLLLWTLLSQSCY